MIEQERTFYVNGVPVTWHEINDWWTNLRNKDPAQARALGDPYYQEKTCWIIANKIVQEIEYKIHGKISNYFEPARDDVNQSYTDVNRAIKRADDIDVDWFDQTAVFRKALEDVERKHREKREAEERQRKQAEYERYMHEQARKQSTNKQSDYVPPPQPKPVVLDWRLILGLSYGIQITEDMIKTAFRKKAMICHPDKGGTEEKMEELLKARDAAYSALGLPLP